MVNQDIPKPNFIIIGSAKCGTTTLADVLTSHPDCCFSRPKEVAFFSHDENYSQGWEWYKKAFAHYQGENAIGEATPNYADRIHHPLSAQRIYEFIPNTKIIFIVRHPYKKLISTWKMHCMLSKFEANKGFEHYLQYRKRHHSILENCLFNYQIKPYQKLFGNNQIKVFFLEDMISNPETSIKELCKFINLDFEKLPIFDKSGSNRADQRIETTNYYKFVSKLVHKLGVHSFVPSSLSNWFWHNIGYRKIEQPILEVSTSYQQEIFAYFQNDAREFLQTFGKPDDFWNFNLLN